MFASTRNTTYVLITTIFFSLVGTYGSAAVLDPAEPSDQSEPLVLVIDRYALIDDIEEERIVFVTEPNTDFILEDLYGSYAGSINLTDEVDTYEGTFRIRLRDESGKETVWDIQKGRVQVFDDLENARAYGFMSNGKPTKI